MFDIFSISTKFHPLNSMMTGYLNLWQLINKGFKLFELGFEIFKYTSFLTIFRESRFFVLSIWFRISFENRASLFDQSLLPPEYEAVLQKAHWGFFLSF